jgi:hypothetical protein
MSERPTTAKLFRAVVVMGTALTSGCGDGKAPPDAPVVADARPTDAAPTDATPTDGAPTDAPADAVLIL